jgi:hypothetical protein
MKRGDPPGAKPGEPQRGRGDFEGYTITTQKRFNPDGAPFSKGSWEGTIVPDIVIAGPDGVVGAVRDLKFPCPSEAKKPGRWKDGQEEMYAAAFGVTPTLIFPI